MYPLKKKSRCSIDFPWISHRFWGSRIPWPSQSPPHGPTSGMVVLPAHPLAPSSPGQVKCWINARWPYIYVYVYFKYIHIGRDIYIYIHKRKLYIYIHIYTLLAFIVLHHILLCYCMMFLIWVRVLLLDIMVSNYILPCHTIFYYTELRFESYVYIMQFQNIWYIYIYKLY